jgi:multiple sugar transport system permease protein
LTEVKLTSSRHDATPTIYIYATVRRYLDFGYGATLVTITFLLLILAVVIVAFFLSKTRLNISGER